MRGSRGLALLVGALAVAVQVQGTIARHASAAPRRAANRSCGGQLFELARAGKVTAHDLRAAWILDRWGHVAAWEATFDPRREPIARAVAGQIEALQIYRPGAGAWTPGSVELQPGDVLTAAFPWFSEGDGVVLVHAYDPATDRGQVSILSEATGEVVERDAWQVAQGPEGGTRTLRPGLIALRPAARCALDLKAQDARRTVIVERRAIADGEELLVLARLPLVADQPERLVLRIQLAGGERKLVTEPPVVRSQGWEIEIGAPENLEVNESSARLDLAVRAKPHERKRRFVRTAQLDVEYSVREGSETRRRSTTLHLSLPAESPAAGRRAGR